MVPVLSHGSGDRVVWMREWNQDFQPPDSDGKLACEVNISLKFANTLSFFSPRTRSLQRPVYKSKIETAFEARADFHTQAGPSPCQMGAFLK